MNEPAVPCVGRGSLCQGCAWGTMIRRRTWINPVDAAKWAHENPGTPDPTPPAVDFEDSYCRNPFIAGYAGQHADAIVVGCVQSCEGFAAR